MDFIFSLLPVIIIFMVVGGKLLETLGRFSGRFDLDSDDRTIYDEENPYPEEVQTYQERGQIELSQEDSGEYQGNNVQREIAGDDRSEGMDYSEGKTEIESEFRKKAREIAEEREQPKQRKLRRKAARSSFKSGQENVLFGKSMSKNDLIRGVVFKEILDKPRAKNPYRPPYSR